MARVTGAEVKAIFETDLTNTDVEEFVTAANLIVTNRLSGTGLSTATLKEVERYLAAHFAAAWDQRVSKESRGDLSVTYQGKAGMNLESTDYGQRALMLDTSGKLRNLGKPAAVFKVLDGNDQT